MKTRAEALSLLQEFTESASLLKHARAVEASMSWYARYFNVTTEDSVKWAITGLLHDFDYEKYPEPTSPDGHPFKGNKILEERGYSADIREAIMGHADYSNVPRTSLMAKALFACDELSGFVTACTLVRPDRSIRSLEVSSVKKRLKDKAFARGCNREDIVKGAQEIGIELDSHIKNVKEALTEISDELGL